MSTTAAGDDRVALKRKAERFFGSDRCGRDEIRGFANRLASLGPAVVIGGTLRDLHLAGARRFASDVDFVVHPGSSAEFDRFVAAAGGRPNRFGGHGISLGRWKVDVWPLERTWAAVHGHHEVQTLDDLLGTTFFDWDAILYSVEEKRLVHGADYFETLRSRTIDINLQPNPNPLGNAVRALRYAFRWRARMGLRLSDHVARQIRDAGWDRLVAYERSAFPDATLALLDGEAFASTPTGCEASIAAIEVPARASSRSRSIGRCFGDAASVARPIARSDLADATVAVA